MRIARGSTTRCLGKTRDREHIVIQGMAEDAVPTNGEGNYFHSLTLMSREAEINIFPEAPEIVANAMTASRCESWRSCAVDACACGFTGTGVSCCSTMPLKDFSENFGRGPEILPDIMRDLAGSPGCHTRIHASVLPEISAPLGSVKSALTPGGLDAVDSNSSARRSSLNVP